MKVLHGAVFLQWTLIAMVIFVLVAWSEGGITGNVVQEVPAEYKIAAAQDPFTGQYPIRLAHRQVDTNDYQVDVKIRQERAWIYSTVYYNTNDGWVPVKLSEDDWVYQEVATKIFGAYTDHELQEGNDFYLRIYSCKELNGEWYCGCKAPGDCGYWYMEGIDFEDE